MLIGVPGEIKQDEYRVGLTPTSVRELVHHGHQVLVQSNAGAGIGMDDEDYMNAGATIATAAAEVYAQAAMIVKVKELQAVEFPLLRPGQLLFTYLHLAPDGPLCCHTKAKREHGGRMRWIVPHCTREREWKIS